MRFDFKEINLINEIINFKIINKNDVLKNYEMTGYKLKYGLGKINYMLNILSLDKIIEKRGYLCCYVSNENFSIETLFSINTSVRKNLIYLCLILSENKFNFYSFSKILKMEVENRKYIKQELRAVLNSLNIDYSEYKNFYNPNFIRSRIRNFETVKRSLLKDTLLECFEKARSNVQTEIEEIKIQIIEQETGIENLKFIHEKISGFFKKYRKISSKSIKYDILSFIALNLKNSKINGLRRISGNSLKLKKDGDYQLLKEAMKEIGKNENQKIYSYFTMETYKMIIRSIDTENIIDSSIQTRNAIAGILRREISDEVQIEKIYRISESTVKFEEEEYSNKKAEIVDIENKRIRTLLVFDFEYDDFIKNIESLERFLNFFNITEIIPLDDLRNENSDNENYDQILIFSNYNIKSSIINRTKKPMFFIKFPEKTAKIQKKVYFDENFLRIKEAFYIYHDR